ncbi:hypothetical protein [Demequina activiva]|uniref:Polyketide cyclase / dehydrase and lipid transport n=1 Tax=Demequina activiva TaxID=1582364 RepID=A0A919UH67_9MICO|nr:hypothetical protein [Demequina activiva]GIG55104.1 hypothetical protein Dac01nite_18560 [Demequina activiva]
MTASDRRVTLDVAHQERIAASRQQILEAELDVAWNVREAGHRLDSLEHDEAGLPLTWEMTARAGLVRTAFRGELVASDPVVMRALGPRRLVETCTTTVGHEADAQGRLLVQWRLVVEITPTSALEHWLTRRLAPWQRRSLQRSLARQMTRWAAAIEAASGVSAAN